MIGSVPENDESMTCLELIAEILADRAINTYRPDRTPTWESANDKLCRGIDSLPVDFDAREELYTKIDDLHVTISSQMYKHGFSDGVRFIIEILNNK
ncbi:hypothetical protein [Sporomusa termitida]|uniref:Uncharacterized protein n=1 Tax=Sporomusa termitida TaxID=2377 RepID=A0A517DPE0_9FIRM|nr:hypothetical protein [Sporomusa termitida]QDR79233.1 hypothetical protein SPTER_05050 [Sporomusa termitida]